MSAPAPKKTAHRPPPVSPELWDRLRRLDPQCSIVLHRDRPNLPFWSSRARRTWRVLIRHENVKLWENVDVEHPTLSEALRAAIEDAEARGWSR